MPFVLTEYDTAFSFFVDHTVRELARARDALIGQIRVEQSSGISGSRIRTRDGMDVDLEPTAVSYGITMNVPAVREADHDALTIELDKAADEQAKGLAEMWLATMQKVTSATGNIVNAGGKLKFEHLYEMLEKIEPSLDENGELAMPTLVMHPDMVGQLPELTEAQNQELADLKQRKHEEALARRRSRRLS